jgi:hypothetical protein
MAAKSGKRKRAVRAPHKKWRHAPCGLRHQMDPFFVGLAAATWFSADPRVWFEAAVAADLRFVAHNGSVIIDQRNGGDPDTRHFLTGLLYGTPDGREVLHDWMRAHKIRAVAID